jgi:hypothetical protein
VLVVVEDGDVEVLDELLLDLEAARRGDVLQVDPSERGGDVLHRLHDLRRLLGVEADREGIDVGELLEQHRLALHDGHCRLGPDVAEPQNGRPVGDDGNRVGLDRVLERLLAVRGDRLAHPRDPGRVGHREVVAGLQRQVQPGVDLAASVDVEGSVGDLNDLGAAHGLDR